MFLLYTQDDPSILDIAISNLSNNIEISLDSANRPSSLSGLDEVDSGLDDIDLSSSHYSWTYFDTETIKRKVCNQRILICTMYIKIYNNTNSQLQIVSIQNFCHFYLFYSQSLARVLETSDLNKCGRTIIDIPRKKFPLQGHVLPPDPNWHRITIV